MLAENFDIQCTLQHDMGTGGSGKWGVFSKGKLRDGNLDLHRWVGFEAWGGTWGGEEAWAVRDGVGRTSNALGGA
jgi:hypothetical protein